MARTPKFSIRFPSFSPPDKPSHASGSGSAHANHTKRMIAQPLVPEEQKNMGTNVTKVNRATERTTSRRRASSLRPVVVLSSYPASNLLHGRAWLVGEKTLVVPSALFLRSAGIKALVFRFHVSASRNLIADLFYSISTSMNNNIHWLFRRAFDVGARNLPVRFTPLTEFFLRFLA